MPIIFLHPYLSITFFALVILGLVSSSRGPYVKNNAGWVVLAAMIILAGFRNMMVDDKAYFDMYNQFGIGMPFSWSELHNNKYGIEWLYILAGKIFYAIGCPFAFFVAVISIFTLTVKFNFFNKNSAYPLLSLAMYMIPTYFAGDMGHIRQSIATAIIFSSFYAIKHRKLWLFLLLIYLAKGFHNSSVIFLPAYWLAVIPIDRRVILIAVLACMALSPFNIYNSITFFSSIAPDDVTQGFQNYSSIEMEDTGAIKFLDLVSLFYVYFLYMYDKVACEKIPYYEYMRNLTVVGICIYFIFRSSPIFSTRLVSYYFLFGTVAIPCIVAAVDRENLRRYLYGTVTAYIVFYFFVFANMQGKRAYSAEHYSNWLIGG